MSNCASITFLIIIHYFFIILSMVDIRRFATHLCQAELPRQRARVSLHKGSQRASPASTPVAAATNLALVPHVDHLDVEGQNFAKGSAARSLAICFRTFGRTPHRPRKPGFRQSRRTQTRGREEGLQLSSHRRRECSRNRRRHGLALVFYARQPGFHIS